MNLAADVAGNRKVLLKFGKNTLWLLANNVIAAALALLAAVLVARHLGPADFGRLAYVWSLAALFGVIGHLGLDGIFVRELKLRAGHEAEVLGTMVFIKFLAFFFAALALLLFGFYFPKHDSTDHLLFVFASSAVLLSVIMILNGWFNARVEGHFVAIAGVSGVLGATLTKVVLVATGSSVVLFGAANVLSVLLTGILLAIFYLWTGGPRFPLWRFNKTLAMRMTREGGLIFIGSIFAVIYLKIDIVMLRWLSESRVVGEYAVAAQISEATYIIPAAIVVSLFPKLVELKLQNGLDYQIRLQQLFDLLLLIAILPIVFVYIFGEDLMPLLFGNEYVNSAAILLIHMLAAPFIFMRYAFSRWIIVEQLAIFSVVTQGCGAFFNVALNLLLIPMFGGEGAAIATVVSYATASYISLSLSVRTRPIFWMMSKALFTPWNAFFRVLQAVTPARKGT